MSLSSTSGRQGNMSLSSTSGRQGNMTLSPIAAGMSRFDAEILQPFLGSTASQLAISDGQMSVAHPLEYLIKAKMLQRQQTPVERQPLPQELATILPLQSNNGQWRPSNRLKQALGGKVPDPPPGVQDWRWATALAVIALRRRPDAIDDTFEAYSRAVFWVDESLLAKAHAQLPPLDLYYPVDHTAVREGRWQAHAAEVLEECGHGYFIPGAVAAEVERTTPEVGCENRSSSGYIPGKVDKLDVVVSGHLTTTTTATPTQGENDPCDEQATRTRDSAGRMKLDLSASATTTECVPCKRMPAQTASQPTPFFTKKDDANATTAVSFPMARRKGIDRDAEEQIRGLTSELKRAAREARMTFKVGDQVESRWRRPTRLDRARLDPNSTWHAARVVQTRKGGALDVVFEDGDFERLNGISCENVRLSSKSIDIGAAVSRCCVVAQTSFTDDSNSDGNYGAFTGEAGLCPASRRELAHIATRTNAIRRAWKDPVTIGAELARLKIMWEEKARDRPEFCASFPAVGGEVTKRLPFGGAVLLASPGRTDKRSKQLRSRRHNRRPAKRHSEKSRITGKLRTRFSLVGSARSDPSKSVSGMERTSLCSPHLLEECHRTDTSGSGKDNITRHGGFATSSIFPELDAAQSNLVSKAMAYDRCVTSSRDCLDRGAATYRAARTYSEQQAAFAETTATLGPAQPARAGYSDWRSRPIVGLQSSTLDVVEAMDAWASAWVEARGDTTGLAAGPAVTHEAQDEKQRDTTLPGVATAPPFVWEGTPLVLTIISQTEKLIGRVPELKEWYGPGFPIRQNPFCLGYPIVDRPKTPCSAFVKAFVKGEIVDTVSPMLLKQREEEEASLKSILDRQASVPSWWPAAQGSMTEDHYHRIRGAEKMLLREWRAIMARRQATTIRP